MLGFGPHLVFDGYECSLKRLEDLDGLYRFLDRLPDQIGMTKIMPPYVFRHGPPGAPDAGVSGFVLIAESHISVHAFPARRYVNVDVFSCEPFAVEDAVKVIKRVFQPRRVDWRLLDRGKEFPKSLDRSRGIVERDRVAIAHHHGLGVSR
jgi:S-adenosylmethionine decarboxylase